MGFSSIPMPTAEQVFPAGGQFVRGLNALHDLNINRLKDRYYGPNIESEINLRGAQTNKLNTMTPLEAEQLKLANQFYPQVTQANIGNTLASTGKTQAETKYMPLDYAIRAQNALTSTNRFGNLGMYLRTIHEMPVAERTAYLADPSNRAQFDAIQNEFLRSSNQQNQNSLLNDKFMGQFGMQGGVPNQLNNTPNNSDYGMAFDKNGNNVRATPEEIDNAVNRPIGGAENIPQESKPYTPTKLDFSQMNANNKLLTAAIKNRRDNAVAMEKWLNKNRENYSRAFRAASKYAGIIGKGERGLDAVKARDPKAYEDLQWLNTSFIPHLSNQVKLMEKMGATDTQREELHGLAGALNKWQLDPEHALNLMNRQIGTIQDISNSVFEAAEPMHQGVTRRMYNMPEINGDYILPKETNSSKELGSTDNPIKVVFGTNGKLVQGNSK